ncbi:type II toxin-antitoxin system prevent-host-death family antitoxin [uncultured Selenomonas sp.]|jgi:prevent-host-death family protein|uniref:type II toxin-antitoxin system prevent-host-death family antitoxin n=1 Tax=uncultured Selenomonas sp. TaxID=159275 RepID=UPI0028E9A94C|nr:type II toxin-antitoxin system prevent-host-death family antitoxin [uncultured Selenomonas sp.]
MPQIRPITDLRNTTEISALCHAKREPLFITKNGYGDLVVMSIEMYEEMLDAARVDAAIHAAEEAYEADGVLMDAREALSSLRRKHFGAV